MRLGRGRLSVKSDLSDSRGLGWRANNHWMIGKSPAFQRFPHEVKTQDPPKARITYLASPTAAATFPHPCAVCTSPAPPSILTTLFDGLKLNLTRGCSDRNLASRRSRAMTSGDEYWARVNTASRPEREEVRRERRARRALGSKGSARGLERVDMVYEVCG